MPLPSPRRLLVTSLLFATLAVPATVNAGGAVLAPSGAPEPAFVDVRMAVAASEGGSTRWVEVTVPASTRALWLVPVRTGAAIDWASPRWLDALDEATAPRVLPPSSAATCDTRTAPERPAPWVSAATAHVASPFAMLATADAARAHVVAQGHRMDDAQAAQVTALYDAGWQLVAVALEASSFARSSTATLRVSDDGGAVLPLALTGTSPTRLTVFAIGAGVAALPGTVPVSAQALRWGASGSNYESWRRETIELAHDSTWLRESASHDALFTASLGGAGASPAEARAGDVDLALALAGLSPDEAIVSRLAGAVRAGTLGTNLAIGFHPGAPLEPAEHRAASHEPCPPASSSGGLASPPTRRPMPAGGTATYEPAEEPASGGCSGGTASTRTGYYEEDTSDDWVVSDGCSGSPSSSSSSSGGSDDWDTGDDDDEGWDTDDGDDGWDTDDGDDGWDTDDDMSPQHVKTTRAPKKTTKRTASPVSRLALLAVALLLPLRRRMKRHAPDERLDR